MDRVVARSLSEIEIRRVEILTIKNDSVRNQPVEKFSKLIDIKRSAWVILSAGPLRRPELPIPHRLLGRRGPFRVFVIHEEAETKVSNDWGQRIWGLQKNITRLDVSVKDAISMGISDRFADLLKDSQPVNGW